MRSQPDCATNDYILTGHPLPTHSYRRSFRLWCCLHMETTNIWTHYVGCLTLIATSVGLHTYARSMSLHLSTDDKFAFGIELTAAAVCFVLSTTNHTLRSHSYKVHHFWGRLDIFGICLLALGGGTSATYYTFFCNLVVQKVYWALISTAAVGAGVVLFDTGGGRSKMRMLRGGVFALLAFTAILPIFHGIGKLGWEQACLILSLGVCLFVGRLPGQLSPGTFDVWGHSHQLHYICAVVGIACHVAALVASYKYWQVYSKC
ncbi:hypothetical protein BU23DRAFT_578098 [Bimuria novae-zelandiae CBS 107.79]|uniref:HlyIII-domain-containing protein n=1 Tax=Bimuria novae-zelandiae CBS 107.79 TaxID=1447943 RepID=A0A6A5VJ30_9PLEO|nr:hypothetical protein BU23DRAFT_578098 [Bimuria novae-zelandiae CBS 107.79]